MSNPSLTDDRPSRTGVRGLLLATAVAGTGACALAAWSWPVSFWAGYLVAALYWLGISLGCLGTALIHGTTGGRWGRAIGRPLHAAIAVLPLGICACWLLALGANEIFPWAGSPSERAELNPHQIRYLQPQAVAVRLAICSGLWLGMEFWLNLRYRQQARDPHRSPSPRRMALAIVVLFLTVSSLVIDGGMSLDPHWYSSIYPLIRLLNMAVAGLAAVVLAYAFPMRHPSEEERDRLHDLGNLLQAYNMLWTYLAFSQYLLIWSGDITEEVQWYLERRTPLASLTSVILFFLHFAVPFVLLLSRRLKRDPRQLSAVAVLLLVMCLVDNAWTVLPSIDAPPSLKVVCTVLASLTLGAVWILLFLWNESRLPDVQVESVSSHEALDLRTLPEGET